MEDYTYIEQKKAHLLLCVFDRKGNYPGEKMIREGKEPGRRKEV